MSFKKYFPAQEATERVFLLIRRHWFTYSIFWIISLLMILPIAGIIIVWVGGFIEITNTVGSLIILGASAYLLGLLAILLYGFVDYYLDVYIVTDRRIVDIRQNGFFSREISELYLQEVQDVNAKVIGFFPTVLHFGDVVIQTAGEVDNFFFNSVPHPYQISKTIMDLHENVVKSAGKKSNIAQPKKYSEEALSKREVSSDVIMSTKEFLNADREKKPEISKKPDEPAEADKNVKKEVKEELSPKPILRDKPVSIKQTSQSNTAPEIVLEEGKQIKIN